MKSVLQPLRFPNQKQAVLSFLCVFPEIFYISIFEKYEGHQMLEGHAFFFFNLLPLFLESAIAPLLCNLLTPPVKLINTTCGLLFSLLVLLKLSQYHNSWLWIQVLDHLPSLMESFQMEAVSNSNLYPSAKPRVGV